MVLVAPNINRRPEYFFSSLRDPHLERQYSSANYFPRVCRGCRFVGISGGAPPPSIPFLFLFPTPVTGAGQATMSPPHHFRDITVEGHPPSSVPPSPNASHQTSNNIVPTISNENSGADEKKDSDSLWGKILTVVNCAIDKGFGFFGFVPPRSINLSNEKVVRLGKFAFIILGFCFALRQAYNLGKASVNSKLDSREKITASEGGENVLRAENGGVSCENAATEGGVNVFRAENGGGSFGNVLSEGGKNVFRAENEGGFCENVVSDQNKNNGGGFGYLSIVAVKEVAVTEKMVSRLLSKMFCFLRLVERNTVDMSKGFVVGSGRKTLDACGVILSECFSCLHFITGQVAVSFGRMGIHVSEFCLGKFWELLQSIKCQAFGLPGRMVGWSVEKVQDALSFYLNKVKEFLRFRVL